MQSHPIAVKTILTVLVLLYIPLAAVGQSVDYDVLIDLDRDGGTGCPVTPSGGAAESGFERRLRATVDTATLQVINVELAECIGSSLQSLGSVGGGYPVGLDVGSGGGDAIELSVDLLDLDAGFVNQVRLAYVADNGAGSDVLVSTDGSAGGPDILLALPREPLEVPTLGVLGLGILMGLLLLAGWLMQRRLGRLGPLSALLLVSVAAWAMNFVSDGEVGDWTGIAPLATDPGGDASDGSVNVDLLAGFAAVENKRLFLRMDVADVENLAPVAVDDAFATDEDTPLSEAAPGVLANDSDGDLDPLTAILDSGPANAQSFTLNADGSFDYTPAADFNGSDSFSYFANDGQANSAAATVTITVNPVNDPPVAVDDTARTDEDQQVDIVVLANDSDIDGSLDPATVTVITPPGNGSTTVNPANGGITYTKSADFNGVDSFVYEVCDDGTPLPALCATATVSITIEPVNDPPEADAGTASTDEDTAVTITLTGSDIEGDALTFAVAIAPGNGSLGTITQLTPTSASVSYTPNADFNGADSFTFTTNDDTVDSDPATISLTVNPINDPPTADPGAATTDEDAPVTITLSGGDVDADPLTFAITSGPANGSLSAITPISDTTAEVTYTPAADFNGNDSFSFTSNDGTVASAPATIALMVNPVNDPPAANDGSTTTEEDIAVTITLTGSDIDGDPLNFAIAGGPTSGALGVITPLTPTTAEVTYTPTTGFSGSDSFSYTANDGTVTSASATISITVTPGNAPPVANTAASSTDEDAPVVITLTGSDADGDPLTFAIATGPGNGVLSAITPVDATSAQVTYTSSANFFGPDNFTFTVNDGTDTSPAATVSLSVNAVNDPPTVVDHTLVTHSSIQITLGAADSELLKDGAADIDDMSADLNVSLLPATSTNGALLTLVDPATGTYQYDPPGGFTGADSFTYEVCDSATTASPVLCATGTVNVTVTGPALWVVDPGAAAGGDGSLNRPLQALSNLPGARAAGARIFLASGNNPGGHTYVANEQLIGQGASGNSFDGFLGVQVPTNGTLDARPGVAGARPVVQGQITLNNGVLARGFNIAPAAGSQGLFGNGAFTGIDVRQLNVATSNATAVNLNGLNGQFLIERVDASGGVNGIALNNFPAGGLFSVIGDESFNRNGSGGTIQNTTGDGVLLINANNVSLRSMNLVNVGDTADSSAGGNNLATNDNAVESQGGAQIFLDAVHINNPAAGGWEAVDLAGSNGIRFDSLIENVDVSNMQALEVRNTNTDMTLFTIDASRFANQDSSNGSSYVLFQSFGSSVMSINVENLSIFEQLFGGGLQANAINTGTVTVTVDGSTFHNAVDGTVGVGASGGLGGIFVAASADATLNYNISNNTLSDIGRPLANAGVVTLQGIGGNNKLLDGRFDNNFIDRIGYPNAAAATGTSTVGHRVVDIVTENDITRLDHESSSNMIDDTSREAFFISSRGASQDFDISLTSNELGQVVPIGSTNREAIEMLSEDSSDMEAIVANNLIAGNTSVLDQVVDIDVENTSFMDMRFVDNTVTNAQPAGGVEVVVDTENGTSTHCMVFTGNTAVDVEFDVNASPSGHRIENFASIAANNPGVTNFLDGAGVTDVAGGTCQQPDF